MTSFFRPESGLCRVWLCAALFFATARVGIGGHVDQKSLAVPANVAGLLQKHCIDCHGGDSPEADFRLDMLGAIEREEGIEALSKVQEQLYFGQMPPEDADPLPDSDKDQITEWVASELAKDGLDVAFRSRIESPKFGNYVDHEKLFSGEFKDLKGFTYDRDWLLSEFIFREKMNALLRVNESQKLSVVGGAKKPVRGHPTSRQITNPFLLPTDSGVRYYANAKMGSGHLMAMVGNAKYASEAMITYLSGKYADFLPSVKAIAAMKLAQDEVLAKRESYLASHIDTLCEAIYKNDNEAWLPAYTPIPFKDVAGKKLQFVDTPRAFHAYRATPEGQVVERALWKFENATKDREAFIRLCEKYFVHHGLPKDKVELLVEKLQVNLEDFLERIHEDADKRSSVLKAKKVGLADDEKKVVEATIRKVRTKGMSYTELRTACAEVWRAEMEGEFVAASGLKGDLPSRIISELFAKIYERQPTRGELDANTSLLLSYSSKMGVLDAIAKLTQTMLLSSEFINRNEYGVGQADQWGRRMMSPRDASYAIAYALTDSSPDEQLVEAARSGKLNTREDYKREVERLLADRSQITIIDPVIQGQAGADNSTDQPIRKIRFFREFFGYHNSLNVFKDEPRFGYKFNGTRESLIAEADLLVGHILEVDKDVFKELLTTDKFYVFHNGDNGQVAELSERVKKAYEYFQKHDWRDFKSAADLEKHKEFLVANGIPGMKFGTSPAKPHSGEKPEKPSGSKASQAEKSSKGGKFEKSGKGQKGQEGDEGDASSLSATFVSIMCDFERRFDNGKYNHIAPCSLAWKVNFGPTRRLGGASLSDLDVSRYYNIDPMKWDYPTVQPAKLDHRKGMLTHPAWLQAFSQNARTDPVTRGKWIREKLLAGTVPETPITVEAQIPDDPTTTVRGRLAAVTEVDYCWRCHKQMNPLGYPFEIYDDFGRYRTEEELEAEQNVIGKEPVKKKIPSSHPLEVKAVRGVGAGTRLFYKTLPVNAAGVLEGTGDTALDGEVSDAFDLIDRLGKSTRVRQSIIRHAFRYFMGRNEMLSDSKTLIDADEAYVKSGGSFDAVIVSLLTSDSFIYRKPLPE